MGIPDSVIGTNSDGQQVLRILDNCMFKSVSVIVTGDVTEQEFVTHSNGNRIIVKGITIVGEGNTGEAKIFRSSNDQCILPVYFAGGTLRFPTGTLWSSEYDGSILADYIYQFKFITRDGGTHWLASLVGKWLNS